MADEFESWLLVWVAVGDKNTCPDCIVRAGMPAMLYKDWVSLGLPGAGLTVCRDRCRCFLMPDELIALFPTLRGGGVQLRDTDDNLRITRKIDTQLYTDLDGLVLRYETITPDWNLPNNYYSIPEVTARI